MRDVVVSVTGVGQTLPVVLDKDISPANISWAAVITGTVTNYNVEFSLDDPFASYATDYNTNATWFPTTTGTALSANGASNLAFPARGLRARIVAGTGTITFTVVTAGITG